ncbi:MAG: YcxB family protein [Clostridia bacterium]|nr:YcxB family protein [Clostridia bacterium]
MITQSGTISVSTQVDEAVQKEFNKPSHTLGVVYTVLGAIALCVGFIGLFVYIFSDSSAIMTSYAMIGLGAIFLTFGIILLIGCNSNLKPFRQASRVEEIEFFNDFMMARGYENGELISTLKVYYGKIVRRRETANYIFLYTSRATAILFAKRNLPESELNTVRGLLNTKTMPAPVQNYQAYGQPAPQDPFADFSQGGSAAHAQPAQPAEQQTQPEIEKSEGEDKE